MPVLGGVALPQDRSPCSPHGASLTSPSLQMMGEWVQPLAMTDFQCIISESLVLTSALNYQGIFGHGALNLKCVRCLQWTGEVSWQGRADMEHDRCSPQTKTSDAISRPNLSVGNYISPFKLLASLSWIKCSLPGWKCSRVLGNSCCGS